MDPGYHAPFEHRQLHQVQLNPQWPSADEMSETDLNNIMAYETMNQQGIVEKEDEGMELDAMEVDENRFDYENIPDFDVSMAFRKLCYDKLLNPMIKWKEKLKAFAQLVKMDLEDHTSYFILRNSDIVLQVGIDQFGSVAACFISWFGAPLRPNEQVRQLILQDRWLTILRALKLMNNLIPHSIILNDRVVCLNALLIIEHDLTLLFKKDKLTFRLHEPVHFWPRSDLQPFTISLDWRPGQFEPNELGVRGDRFICQLTIAPTTSVQFTFPTQSCLNEKLKWIQVSQSRPVNAAYCLSFPKAIPVQEGLMKKLLDVAGGMAVATKTNWFSEAADGLVCKRISFGESKTLSFIIEANQTEEQTDFLVKKITVSSPQGVVEVLNLLVEHIKMFGLIKNLFSIKDKKELGVKRDMALKLQLVDYNQIHIEVDSNSIIYGNVDVTATGAQLSLHLNINSALTGRLLGKDVQFHVDGEHPQEICGFEKESEAKINEDWSLANLFLNISERTSSESKSICQRLLDPITARVFRNHYKMSSRSRLFPFRFYFRMLRLSQKKMEAVKRGLQHCNFRWRLLFFMKNSKSGRKVEIHDVESTQPVVIPSTYTMLRRRETRRRRTIGRHRRRRKESKISAKSVISMAKYEKSEGFVELQKALKSGNVTQRQPNVTRRRRVNILKRRTVNNPQNEKRKKIQKQFKPKTFGLFISWKPAVSYMFRRQGRRFLSTVFSKRRFRMNVNRFGIEKMHSSRLPDIKDMFKNSNIEMYRRKLLQMEGAKMQNQIKKQDPYSRYPDFTNMPPPQTTSIFPTSQFQPMARTKLEIPMNYQTQDEEDSSDDNETDPPPPPKVPANNNQIYQPHLLAARNERLNKIKQDQKERELEQQKLKASQQNQLQRAARINQIGQRLSLNAEQSENALKSAKLESASPPIKEEDDGSNDRPFSRRIKSEIDDKDTSPSSSSSSHDDNSQDSNLPDESNFQNPPQLEMNKEKKQERNSNFPSPDSSTNSPPPSLAKSDEDSKSGPPLLQSESNFKKEEESPRPVKKEDEYKEKKEKEARKEKDEKKRDKKEKDGVKKDRDKRDRRLSIVDLEEKKEKLRKDRDDASTSSSSSIKSSRIAVKPLKDMKKEVVKDKTKKSKDPRDYKLREPSPVLTRKRTSPIPTKKRDREEPKKIRIEEKPGEKLTKTIKTGREEPRSGLKRPATSQLDDKKKKLRKTSDRTTVEREKEKVERKDSTSNSALQDVLGNMGRPTINSLRNFKIPKVVEPDPKPESSAPPPLTAEKKEKQETASASTSRDDRRDGPREGSRDSSRDGYREYGQNYSNHSTGKMFFGMPNFGGANRTARRGSIKGNSQGSFDSESSTYRSRKAPPTEPMKSPTFSRSSTSSTVVGPYVRDKPPNSTTQLGRFYNPSQQKEKPVPTHPAPFHQAALVQEKYDRDFRDQRDNSPIDGLQIDEG
uniref:SHR-BD domain-containing protein n=1 Tax=Bursaphelenchus xylophilus TaxID=6326 RepID=A0A1I7RZF2_BURXY